MVESYLVPEGTPKADASNLLLTEIHYEPLGSSTNEFLEFLNTSARTVDVSDVVVTQALSFRFPRPTLR